MNELQLIYDIATNLSDYLICIGILTFLWLVGMDDGLRERSTDMSGNNQNDDDLKRRLRKHNDERLYLEADELMCEAADRIEQLEKERDEATSAVKRLSDGQPFDAVVIADTVKRRTAQLESERDELLACLNLIYSWANNWDSEFMNDPDWKNTDYPRIQAAIAKLKGQS